MRARLCVCVCVMLYVPVKTTVMQGRFGLRMRNIFCYVAENAIQGGRGDNRTLP